MFFKRDQLRLQESDMNNLKEALRREQAHNIDLNNSMEQQLKELTEQLK